MRTQTLPQKKFDTNGILIPLIVWHEWKLHVYKIKRNDNLEEYIFDTEEKIEQKKITERKKITEGFCNTPIASAHCFSKISTLALIILF